MDSKNIGPNMRRLRQARGMTATELGRRLDCSGVYVGKLERGDKTPSVGRLLDLADILGVSTDDLLKKVG